MTTVILVVTLGIVATIASTFNLFLAITNNKIQDVRTIGYKVKSGGWFLLGYCVFAYMSLVEVRLSIMIMPLIIICLGDIYNMAPSVLGMYAKEETRKGSKA